MATFGERLEQLLTTNNDTLQSLANKIDTTRSTLSRYKNGKREPKLHIVDKIANEYNVSVDYLLGRTDYKNLESKIKTLIPEKTINYLDQEDMKFINALAQDEQRQALMKTTQDMGKEDLERFIRMAKAFEEKKID